MTSSALPHLANDSRTPRSPEGGRRLAELMAARDWSVAPPTLRTLVGIILASPLPMFLAWGPQRTLLYNDAFAALLAEGHPAALGSDLLEAWPQGRAVLATQVARVMAGDAATIEHLPLGTHIVAFDLVPIRDDGGTVVGLYCPHVQAAVDQATVRARNVLDGMVEGYVHLDRDFRVLEINARGLQLEGRPASEIIGKSHWEAWPGSEHAELGQLYKKAIRETVPVRLDHHFTWPSGHDAWLEMRAFPTSEGLAIFYRDVSVRKRAEARALRSDAVAEASAAEQAAVLRQLAEGVIVTDTEGRITIVNQAAADIHGVERLDVVPEDYSKTYHLFTEDGQPYDPLLLPLARAVRGETVKDVRWRIRRPDGADVLAIGSARPWRDAEGRQVGAVLTLRDDTARDAAERSLRELNETLEQRVQDRTAELDAARREADEARRQAESANEAKSEFLASMSHEIRTPLHGVLGLADLLLDSQLDTSQRHNVGRLQSAGGALLTVVNDILDFSKIEAGRIELDPQPFVLDALIDGTVSIVRAAAEMRRLTLKVDYEGELPPRLIGDEARLRQILLNLLNNAIKFTPDGSVTLKVARLRGTHGQCALLLSVTDTGIGIPHNKVDRLFERFSQVDGSIRRNYGGTGLGLAISKRLVDLMGGQIEVESEEGRGSTFAVRVVLPIAADTEPVGAVDAAPAATTASGAAVLVVDDVDLNLDIARAVLEKADHLVDTVTDGAAAVAAVQARRYDLVLMDVQMPGMDGIVATRHIRALPDPLCRIPIIAMTANVLPHQRQGFLAAGMDDHIGKPFERDALYAMVAKWRGGRP